MRTIKIALGHNKINSDGEYAGTDIPNPYTWEAEKTLFWLSQHEETDNKVKCLYLTPGHFELGDRRKKSVAKGGDVFCFDFDGVEDEALGYATGVSDTWLRAKLDILKERNISYALATSYNHDRKAAEGHSRCRVSIVAERTITPDEWLSVWLYWANFFDSKVDAAPCAPNSIFHRPSKTPDATRAWSDYWIAPEGGEFSVSVALDHNFTKNDLFGRNTAPRKIRLNSKHSKTTKTVTVEVDENLPGDIILSSLLGDIKALDIAPGQKISNVFSPWRNDENPSAFAWCTDNGIVYVQDSGDGERRRVTGRSDKWNTPMPEVFHLSSSIERDENKWNKAAYVSDIIGNLDHTPSQYHLVRAPLGAGKTTWMRQQAVNYGSVICQIDTVALAKSCAKDFALEEYTDLRNHTPEKLCTTTHSAHRFVLPCDDGINVGWDLAIQDEIVGIMNAWVSPILKGMGQIAKECTLDHATSGGTSVFMSADFTPELMDLVETLIKARDPRANILRHEIPPTAGQREIVLYPARKWKQELMDEAQNHQSGDLPVVTIATSTEAPHSLAKEIDALGRGLRTLAISSENSDTPEIRELLADPNKILKDYDFIFLSPTVKAGFSFDLPVKRVFAKYTGGVVARDFCQMIMRCRNLQDTNIVTYVTESKGEWNTDPNYLAKLALRKGGLTEANVDTSMIHFSIDPQTRERRAHDPELLKIWVHFERERRITENNRLRTFLQKCAFHGWSFSEYEEDVTEEQAEALAESARKAREERENERQTRLLGAERIGESQADELDNAHIRTPEEKSSLERYRIETFYDKDISKDIIEQDKKGRTRRIVRDWEVFSRWQKGEKDAGAIKDYHNTNNKQATEYGHTMLRMAKLDQLVRLGLEGTLEEFEGSTITKADIVERFEDWLSVKANRQGVQETLGGQCTEASAENPSKWFFEITKRVGAQWESKRCRVNGELVREYTLDLSSIRDLAKAESTRIDKMIDDMTMEDGLDVEEMLLSLAA